MKNIYIEAFEAAKIASNETLELIGESYPFGFAWVKAVFKHKGNTKLGREERKEFRELGFTDDYCGGLQIWNPSKINCQNMTAKYRGAVAFVNVLKKHGISAIAQERMD
jgi:hypothetical protein